VVARVEGESRENEAIGVLSLPPRPPSGDMDALRLAEESVRGWEEGLETDKMR